MNQTIKSRLDQIISSLSPKKVMVIGDLMLDQYIWGKVERISPEGPIPVLRVEKEEFRLGGAANVAVNIKNLDCLAYPIGIVGEGSAGKQVMSIFKRNDISITGLVVSGTFKTIVKQRAITHQQQLLRIDYENPKGELDDCQDQLHEKIEQLLPRMDAVIFSDYAKGVLSENLISKTILLAKKYDIPVICDPGKGIDFSCYKNITAIKPNRTEAEQATGMLLNDRGSILMAAGILKQKCNAEFLAISLDKDGILYFKNGSSFSFIDTEIPEVYDVTGAGDMVTSILGVLLANKVSHELTVNIANIAAGLETSHFGVVPIPWVEIQKYINADGLNKKITTLDQLKKGLLKNGNTPLVFTNGYFDNISAGHLRFLFEISKIPGELVVAINSDECIKRQKGTEPLLKEKDRLRLLASIENVHYVIVFEEDDASGVISTLSPDIVVKGDKFKNLNIPEYDAIKEVKAKIEYIEHFAW